MKGRGLPNTCFLRCRLVKPVILKSVDTMEFIADFTRRTRNSKLSAKV
jgi:hypothetical protein